MPIYLRKNKKVTTKQATTLNMWAYMFSFLELSEGSGTPHLPPDFLGIYDKSAEKLNNRQDNTYINSNSNFICIIYIYIYVCISAEHSQSVRGSELCTCSEFFANSEHGPTSQDSEHVHKLQNS